ncbi:MAG: N-acyl-L-amino acid amidohydrolase [Symbiobacteriaceae bacterium]|jgi:amidohydrolase|nr:N-acyl-L-amino acid amidohydrolase [Symbiobacteriaceae bacterium]
MWTKDQIWNLAHAVYPSAVDARRQFHRNPELSFEEKETSAFIAAQLDAMGVPYTAGVGGYGIKAVIEGGKPGRTVALRADMDALPINEETGLPFASQKPGVMHACGHDVHTATLLATARALRDVAADLPGRVVLIFQPGEEVNPGGASLMIKDGVLVNPTVDAIFGLHVMPLMEAGTMGFGAGPMLAAPDEFDVTIVGRGGHGAAPQLCVDPVMVAAQCLTLLQQIVARNVSPFQSAVITVGTIHGGTARNVIPDEVTFKGTVRTMDPAVQALMPQRIEAVIRGVCEAAGAAYKLHYDPGYPALINDAAATDIARRAALRVLDAEKVQPMAPSMGGEDFAFYLQKVPGSFARLGSMISGTASPAGLHTARLMIDENCMATGVAYYLSVVQEYLGEA